MPVQVEKENKFDATLCAKDARKLAKDIKIKAFSIMRGENVNVDIENQLNKMIKSCNLSEGVKMEILRDFYFLKQVIKGEKEGYRSDYITGKTGIARPNEILLDLENEIRDYALISIENKGRLD